MRRSRVGSSVFAVVGLVVSGAAVVGLAGLAGLATGIGPHVLQAEGLSGQSLVDETLREAAWRSELMGKDDDPEAASPATVVAQRFTWDGAVASAAGGEMTQPARGMVMADAMNMLPVEQMTLFSPSFAYPGATLANLAGTASVRIAETAGPAAAPERTPVTVVAAATSSAPTPAATPERTPATVVAAATSSAPTPAPAAERTTVVAAATPSAPPAAAATLDAAARHHVAAKFDNILNDAQIASIKKRLKLTPDQEQMWPAVETALRRIAYKTATAARRQPKNTDVANSGRQRSGLMAYIDPDSAEVQQLKYAAIPLIMRLNDDQKREVKSLAHVMGLGGVASEF